MIPDRCGTVPPHAPKAGSGQIAFSGSAALGASDYDYTEQFERGHEHILNTIDQLRP